MRLHDTVALAMRGFGARVRRDLIVYAICAACAVAALTLATWSSVLALIPVVGWVYAPLVVAGFFLLVIAATLVWLQLARSRSQAAAPMAFGAQAAASQRQAQFAQIAMIIEAVMLGYTMSRRPDRR